MKKIEFIIDENGQISSETEGFFGEDCILEVEEFLNDNLDNSSLIIKNEYYQKVEKEKIKQRV